MMGSFSLAHDAHADAPADSLRIPSTPYSGMMPFEYQDVTGKSIRGIHWCLRAHHSNAAVMVAMRSAVHPWQNSVRSLGSFRSAWVSSESFEKRLRYACMCFLSSVVFVLCSPLQTDLYLETILSR